MAPLWRACLVVALAGLPCALAAQQDTDTTPVEGVQLQIAPAILTVDIERLFVQSQFGQRLSAQITQAGQELQVENRRIAAELRAEELDLAARRPDMDAADFRAEAEAFDTKAQAIRQEQDAKEVALEEAIANARTQFFDVTRPILDELLLSSGALVVLDRRSVVLSRDAVDITNAALERIDATIGDGTQMPDLDVPTDPSAD